MILLRTPFFPKYHSGYIRVSKDGRRRIDLYGSEKSRTTMSYARYLMCVHLNKFLPDDVHVDHINNDFTDDRLENLQILSVEENVRKTSATGRTTKKLKCFSCGISFTRELRQIHPGNTYCSIDCRILK